MSTAAAGHGVAMKQGPPLDSDDENARESRAGHACRCVRKKHSVVLLAVPEDDCRARRRQWSRAGRWLREVWLQAFPLALRYQCFRARPLRAHRDPQRCRHGPPHRAAAAERHLSVGASFWDHDPPRQRGGADSRVGDRDDLRGLQHSGGGVGERPSATRAGLRRCRLPNSSGSRDRKAGRARTSCRTRCSCTSPIVATRPSVIGFRQKLDSTITA